MALVAALAEGFVPLDAGCDSGSTVVDSDSASEASTVDIAGVDTHQGLRQLAPETPLTQEYSAVCDDATIGHRNVPGYERFPDTPTTLAASQDHPCPTQSTEEANNHGEHVDATCKLWRRLLGSPQRTPSLESQAAGTGNKEPQCGDPVAKTRSCGGEAADGCHRPWGTAFKLTQERLAKLADDMDATLNTRILREEEERCTLGIELCPRPLHSSMESALLVQGLKCSASELHTDTHEKSQRRLLNPEDINAFLPDRSDSADRAAGTSSACIVPTTEMDVPSASVAVHLPVSLGENSKAWLAWAAVAPLMSVNPSNDVVLDESQGVINVGGSECVDRSKSSDACAGRKPASNSSSSSSSSISSSSSSSSTVLVPQVTQKPLQLANLSPPTTFPRLHGPPAQVRDDEVHPDVPLWRRGLLKRTITHPSVPLLHADLDVVGVHAAVKGEEGVTEPKRRRLTGKQLPSWHSCAPVSTCVKRRLSGRISVEAKRPRKGSGQAKAKPARKRWLDAVPQASARPSRRGEKPCVAMTGVTLREGLRKGLERMGASIVSEWVPEVSLLVADEFKRTLKLMCAICRGVPVVTYAYLVACDRSSSWLDTRTFLLRDGPGERAFSKKHSLKRFSVAAVVSKTQRQGPVLQGHAVLVLGSTPRHKRKELEMLVNAAGADWVDEPPGDSGCICLVDSVAIGKGKGLAAARRQAGDHGLYDLELLFEAAITQKLQLDKFRL